MANRFRLYGVRGWGSVLVEAALAKAGAPFDFIDVTGFDEPGASRQTLLAVNPLAQTPTVQLPSGEVMTESAAIILYLSEVFADAGLAPPSGTAERPAFLRRLVWLAASVYSTFIYGDYPARWAPSAAVELRDAVHRHRQTLWLSWESEVEPGPWVLGERFSALDIYVAAMSRWRPQREWFDVHCPKLMSSARLADEQPELRPVWERNFSTAAV